MDKEQPNSSRTVHSRENPVFNYPIRPVSEAGTVMYVPAIHEYQCRLASGYLKTCVNDGDLQGRVALAAKGVVDPLALPAFLVGLDVQTVSATVICLGPIPATTTPYEPSGQHYRQSKPNRNYSPCELKRVQ